ncbi:MAG TPA: protein kinase [Planctomycetota bacterium]|nr:protein kinase [Planctomycetota bacterium]
MSVKEVTTPADSPFPELKGFRILLELGRSPKGITYKARRLVEQDVVALKVFRPSLCDRKFVQELPKNAEASFLLEHRGMVRSLGCVHEGGTLMLMTEYALGEPASKFLQRERPMSLPKALRVALQCANALRYAATHKKYHGRLHPADIILGEDDARIVGVGLGERPEHAAWSVKDPYLYEPLIYTAPEALPSHATVELNATATDVYSLGAILFHLLTGNAPFKSNDEESLVGERKRLLGSVQWPAEMQRRLPENVLRLVERMMLPDPASRPTYDDLISALSIELSAAEKEEARKELSSLAEKSVSGHQGGVRTAVSASAAAPAAAPANGGGAMPARPMPTRTELQNASMLTRLYTLFLVGMTALAFIVVFGFTALIFVYAPLKKNQSDRAAAPAPAPAPVQPAQPVLVTQPPLVAVPAPEPKRAEPAPSSDARSDEYLSATRQLEYIQDMLSKKEIKHTPAVLRLARGIAEKAGRDSPTGVKALVLAAEIEETILRQTGVRPEGSAPVETPPKTIPAVGNTGIATVEKTSPATSVTPPENVLPAKSAETAVAQPSAQAQPPAPAPEKAMTPPPPAIKVEPSKIAGSLKAAQASAKAFQYPAQNIEIEKMLKEAQGEDKKLADAFWNAARLEQDLVKRCRARLLEQIQRHPRKDSPLQVFPRKNDPNGDDITDFDEAGLKIVTKKGPASSTRVQPWDKVPPLQAFMLLQLLAEKTSADDNLGLAVFANSRGLKNEVEESLNAAAAIPEGRDRAAALREYFKYLNAVLEPSK